ncbi:hypothetical protein MT340_011915 [Staphylococcus sp. NRL 16/872]|uniref:hypothetical protein n=1 Tax=Staphylococcus sp. NRL 16/872 TaxID=2930131 RepID=UPI001FB35945|nr:MULTISPECIES: hypothetical protein [unclassified Staphylococcus]MCJ1657187.1 hypothetical protein [Staphylococcus sp. NRL 21/187]MCJ1662926.1 hypothetical protein [Staphylococcus sp. NRL 18/288]MCJ1669052.1 hypothetical protein [Staphylococcus sp. NRL 19/737]WEN69273.1 hypothetical protein MT340_011915 [Staphylococcus sp. NRL 16/872]
MKKIFGVLLTSTLILGACSTHHEISDVTNKFKKEGLNVDNLKKMKREDFGMAPMKAKDAKMFTVTDNKNARILKFENENDLKDTKKYYDELGKASGIFYSHTYAKDDILMQMNGDIDDKVFDKYKDAMKEALK